jgi:hypothetical protein
LGWVKFRQLGQIRLRYVSCPMAFLGGGVLMAAPVCVLGVVQHDGPLGNPVVADSLLGAHPHVG